MNKVIFADLTQFVSWLKKGLNVDLITTNSKVNVRQSPLLFYIRKGFHLTFA